MNGSMVPLPDSAVTLTAVGDGIHLNGKTGDMVVDEDFDKNMLLTQALVVSSEIKVLAKPTFANTADGLIAATALEQGLTVVTRNVKDFAGLGVDVFNPWEGA